VQCVLFELHIKEYTYLPSGCLSSANSLEITAVYTCPVCYW